MVIMKKLNSKDTNVYGIFLYVLTEFYFRDKKWMKINMIKLLNIY